MNNDIARINMIKQQLRTGKVINNRIIELFDTISRDAFVPDEHRFIAYSDAQIPLPHEQCMMTPLEEALLLQSLDLQGHETVLEIGTGTGFLTALLSRSAKKVISIDYYADFTNRARQKLHDNQCTNVELYTGDASQGWFDKAPYDVMVFTSSMNRITDTERLQLLPNGKLFTITGKKPVMQAHLHTLSDKGLRNEHLVFETCIPPLIKQTKENTFDFQDKTTC